MKYSNLFHWCNYGNKQQLAHDFYSKLAANIGSFPLPCDLSVALCENQAGDALVHLFLDAVKNDVTDKAGKKVWEIVHEFCESCGCSDPQGWDDLSTASITDIPRSLAKVGVKMKTRVKREEGHISCEDAKTQQDNFPNRQFAIAEKVEAGFACPKCSTPIAFASGKTSPAPGMEGWVQVEVSCPNCGVRLKTRIPTTDSPGGKPKKPKRWWQFW